MENGVDFIYEYSDLNLFQTRVEVLRGEYAGLILEFGGSALAQWGDKNSFTFNYTLYKKPARLKDVVLRGDANFEKYLADLLISIISARHLDPKEKENLEEAAASAGKRNSKIHIPNKFYLDKLNKQPVTQRAQGF